MQDGTNMDKLDTKNDNHCNVHEIKSFRFAVSHSGNPFQASAISHFQDLTICIHD